MNPVATISIALVLDEGDGVLFFTDVCSMLERIARRANVPLEVLSQTSTSRIFGLGLELSRELEREIGLHRAQLVPRDSVSGRVVTAKVVVAVAPVPDAHLAPLKTYSYANKRVAFHETGETVPLDVVLAGEG